MRDFGAKPDPMGQAQLYGTLEFYDPATETKLFERSFSQFGSTDINVPGLPPGSYKLRWLPNSMLGQSSSPNWWPNANTYADASPVAVSAGTVTADIHFFLAGPATAPAPPKLAGPSVLNPATHTFSLPITTESGGYYQLQKSFSMREGTWFNIGWANYGSGSPITLTDPDANEPAAFYRASRN